MARLNRRHFLVRTAAAGAGLAAPAGIACAQMVGAEAPFDDYRALVCVFLYGGNDSFNMLVPRSTAEHNAYAASRQNLSIPREDLLTISPANRDGVEYGLHPAMARLQRLFESGHAAFIANIGPLIEPTTKEQYKNRSVSLPPQLFSHNDQQNQWHSLRGTSRSQTGWAGRIADLIRERVAAQRLPTNVSLNGNTLFQSGDRTVAYTMGADGPLRFAGFGDTGNAVKRRLAFERILRFDYDSIYARAFAEIEQRALDRAESLAAAIESAPALATAFPQSPLGTQLATVARVIAVRGRLEMQRQIFFVAAGGFDTHDDQIANQPRLLGDVSEVLGAFYDATVELGVAGNVTTFTQSDFGRTLTSNGDGTDHGWGGVQIVLGDAVLGRRLYGAYPSLELDGPEDAGAGRMIPSVSADQYAATLAKWFGIPDADLDAVAPHLGNFGQRDLGFLA